MSRATRQASRWLTTRDSDQAGACLKSGSIDSSHVAALSAEADHDFHKFQYICNLITTIWTAVKEAMRRARVWALADEVR